MENKILEKTDKPKVDVKPPKIERKRSVKAGDRLELMTFRIGKMKKSIKALYKTSQNLPSTSDKKNAAKKDIAESVIKQLRELKAGVDRVILDMQSNESVDICTVAEEGEN